MSWHFAPSSLGEYIADVHDDKISRKCFWTLELSGTMTRGSSGGTTANKINRNAVSIKARGHNRTMTIVTGIEGRVIPVYARCNHLPRAIIVASYIGVSTGPATTQLQIRFPSRSRRASRYCASWQSRSVDQTSSHVLQGHGRGMKLSPPDAMSDDFVSDLVFVR